MRGTMQCDTRHYSTFLLYLVLLVIFGFVLGHISHSPKKLFKILNKMYIYLVLPCIALKCGIAIRFSSWDSSLKDDIIITDLLVKAVFWLVIVVGALVIYRDREILKSAALAAQFVVHGNDIGFTLPLLDSSCYMYGNGSMSTSESGYTSGYTSGYESASSGHTKFLIDFSSIELSANAIAFLIFLPLTKGLVGMSEKGSVSIKQFIVSTAGGCLEMTFSYLCLIIGVIMAVLLPGDNDQFNDKYQPYFKFINKMIDCSSTLQTLLCGVYIYYILMQCNWGHVNTKKAIWLSMMVAVIYPAVYCGVIMLITGNTHPADTEIIIVLGHSSTPASIYIQYYILQHLKQPTNYIVAFLVSTFLGSILMYSVIMDLEVYDGNDTLKYMTQVMTPTDNYTQTQRLEFLVMSIVVSFCAILIYARRKQAVFRRLIFILITCKLVSDIIVATTMKLSDCSEATTMAVHMFLSGFLMCIHIFNAMMIIIMSTYTRFTRIIKTRWKVIVSVLALVSLGIPTLLHLIVWANFLYLDNKSTLSYNIQNHDYFLDIMTRSNWEIKYPISSGAYCVINIILLIIYLTVFVLKRRSHRESELLVNVDDDDKEKFVPCKLIAYYQTVIIVLSLSFAVRNLDYRGIRSSDKNTAPEVFADYILEEVELFSTILKDLLGLVLTIVFCVSPGRMENEFERFMYIPRHIKSFFTRCSSDATVTPVENLPVEDLDRCRRFIMYHKPAFISIYPPIIRNDMVTFSGRELVEFLIDTTVADSLSEAIDVAGSYIKGNIFKSEGNIFRRSFLSFREDDTRYVFTPEEELPNFQEILNGWEQPFPYYESAAVQRVRHDNNDNYNNDHGNYQSISRLVGRGATRY